MKMPRSVKVEGVRYAVKGLPRDEAHQHLNGIIYFEDEGPEIMVEGRLGGRKKATTLLHEMLHAILIPMQMSDKGEESLVLRLEAGLADAMENNPGTFREIIRTLRQTRT
jgi:hypothetical protein